MKSLTRFIEKAERAEHLYQKGDHENALLQVNQILEKIENESLVSNILGKVRGFFSPEKNLLLAKCYRLRAQILEADDYAHAIDDYENLLETGIFTDEILKKVILFRLETLSRNRMEYAKKAFDFFERVKDTDVLHALLHCHMETGECTKKALKAFGKAYDVLDNESFLSYLSFFGKILRTLKIDREDVFFRIFDTFPGDLENVQYLQNIIVKKGIKDEHSYRIYREFYLSNPEDVRNTEMLADIVVEQKMEDDFNFSIVKAAAENKPKTEYLHYLGKIMSHDLRKDDFAFSVYQKLYENSSASSEMIMLLAECYCDNHVVTEESFEVLKKVFTPAMRSAEIIELLYECYKIYEPESKEFLDVLNARKIVFPERNSTMYYMANVYYAQSQETMAVSYLREFLFLEKNRYDMMGKAHCFMALILCKSRIREPARISEHLEKAVKLMPNDEATVIFCMKCYFFIAYGYSQCSEIFCTCTVECRKQTEKTSYIKKALQIFDKARAIAPEHADVILYDAKKLMEENQFEQAIHQFERHFEREKNILMSTVCNYVKCLYRLQKFDAALMYLEKHSSSRHPGILFSFAACYYKKGWYDEAIDYSTRVLKQGIEISDVYYIRGKAYFKKGWHSIALQDLSRATALEPENNNYQFHLAKTYFRADNYKSAQDNFLELYKKGYLKALSSFYLGCIYNIQKDYASALMYFETSDSQDTELDNSTRIAVLQNIAEICFKHKQDYTKALNYCERALELSPMNPDVILLRARVFLKTGNIKASHEDLNDVLHSGRNEAYLELAKLFYIEKNVDMALSSIESFIKSFPDDARGYLWYGNFQKDRGEYSKALELYRSAQKHDMNLYEVYQRKAEAFYAEKEYTKALLEIRKYLQYVPDDTDAYIIESRCNYRLGDIKNAIKAVEDCLKISPDNPQALTEKCILNFRTLEWDKMKAVFKTLSKTRYNPEMLQKLGSMVTNAEENAFYQPVIIYSVKDNIRSEVLLRGKLIIAFSEGRKDSLLSSSVPDVLHISVNRGESGISVETLWKVVYPYAEFNSEFSGIFEGSLSFQPFLNHSDEDLSAVCRIFLHISSVMSEINQKYLRALMGDSFEMCKTYFTRPVFDKNVLSAAVCQTCLNAENKIVRAVYDLCCAEISKNPKAVTLLPHEYISRLQKYLKILKGVIVYNRDTQILCPERLKRMETGASQGFFQAMTEINGSVQLSGIKNLPISGDVSEFFCAPFTDPRCQKCMIDLKKGPFCVDYNLALRVFRAGRTDLHAYDNGRLETEMFCSASYQTSTRYWDVIQSRILELLSKQKASHVSDLAFQVRNCKKDIEKIEKAGAAYLESLIYSPVKEHSMILCCPEKEDGFKWKALIDTFAGFLSDLALECEGFNYVDDMYLKQQIYDIKKFCESLLNGEVSEFILYKSDGLHFIVPDPGQYQYLKRNVSVSGVADVPARWISPGSIQHVDTKEFENHRKIGIYTRASTRVKELELIFGILEHAGFKNNGQSDHQYMVTSSLFELEQCDMIIYDLSCENMISDAFRLFGIHCCTVSEIVGLFSESHVIALGVPDNAGKSLALKPPDIFGKTLEFFGRRAILTEEVKKYSALVHQHTDFDEQLYIKLSESLFFRNSLDITGLNIFSPPVSVFAAHNAGISKIILAVSNISDTGIDILISKYQRYFDVKRFEGNYNSGICITRISDLLGCPEVITEDTALFLCISGTIDIENTAASFLGKICSEKRASCITHRVCGKVFLSENFSRLLQNTEVYLEENESVYYTKILNTIRESSGAVVMCCEEEKLEKLNHILNENEIQTIHVKKGVNFLNGAVLITREIIPCIDYERTDVIQMSVPETVADMAYLLQSMQHRRGRRRNYTLALLKKEMQHYQNMQHDTPDYLKSLCGFLPVKSDELKKQYSRELIHAMTLNSNTRIAKIFQNEYPGLPDFLREANEIQKKALSHRGSAHYCGLSCSGKTWTASRLILKRIFEDFIQPGEIAVYTNDEQKKQYNDLLDTYGISGVKILSLNDYNADDNHVLVIFDGDENFSGPVLSGNTEQEIISISTALKNGAAVFEFMDKCYSANKFSVAAASAILGKKVEFAGRSKGKRIVCIECSSEENEQEITNTLLQSLSNNIAYYVIGGQPAPDIGKSVYIRKSFSHCNYADTAVISFGNTGECPDETGFAAALCSAEDVFILWISEPPAILAKLPAHCYTIKKSHKESI